MKGRPVRRRNGRSRGGDRVLSGILSALAMSGVLSDDSDDEAAQYSDKGLVYLQGFMKKRAQGRS